MLLALCAVVRAAWRVGWLEPRTSLDELVSKLRSRRRGRSSFDPSLARGIVERLLPVLPPFGAGRCVKRSLLLLELWSRAGLEPCLHVGMIRGDRIARKPDAGHLWVTTASEDYRTPDLPDIAEFWHG
jgi:hypothetical protein